MDWRVLLGCVSLWAGLALAEVGSFDACRQYFYKRVQPRGFDKTSMAQICQRYNNRYHFATLYDKSYRIPQWSAYILNVSDCPERQQPPTRSQWLVEPQLTNLDTPPEMKIENESSLSRKELRSSQAINEDYEDTLYDRGQLNPYSFQCHESCMATFTLTNAAPMESCFKHIRWSKLEKSLKRQLAEYCIKGGIPYIVTGAVPSDSEKIPKIDEDWAGDHTREYKQVSVPSHIWTAVCCDHPDDNHKFSFAFLAENKAESKLQMFHVEQLNSELSHLYQSYRPVKVFVDNCNSQSQKGQKILSEIKSALNNTFQIVLTDYYSQLLPSEMRLRLDQETSQVMRSTYLGERKMQLTDIKFLISFPSLEDWSSNFKMIYNQDNLACVLSPVAAAEDDSGEVTKLSGRSARVCMLQQQKHLPRSGITAQGWSCIGLVCEKRKGKPYSWCYTSHRNNWDYCCTDKCAVNPTSNQYECSRGDGESTKCSPQYSTVTISGNACRADHPCGLYGKSYYWCYTDYKESWEHCCSPHHFCGKHGYDYSWCYTEVSEESWRYCTP